MKVRNHLFDRISNEKVASAYGPTTLSGVRGTVYAGVGSIAASADGPTIFAVWRGTVYALSGKGSVVL